MKPYIICIGLLFFLSCVKSDPNKLIIDLDQSEESIKYSTFIDSISYRAKYEGYLPAIGY